MRLFASLSLALALLASSPSAGSAQQLGLCDFMAGKDVAPTSASLADSLQKAQQGLWKEAFLAAHKVVADLSDKAASLFLGASSPDGYAEARALVDTELLTASGVLAVRTDYFSVRQDITSWLAWLGCKAGQTQQALFWLRIGTRDHRDPRFSEEAALVYLASGATEGVAPHLAASPELLHQRVASGWYLCLTGSAREGAALLEKASSQATNADTQKLLLQWAGLCSAGKLKSVGSPAKRKGNP